MLARQWHFIGETTVLLIMKLSKKNSIHCIPLEGDKSLALPGNIVESLVSYDPEEIVLQLKENLHLNETDLKQPTPETTRMIRCLAATAKESNRIDVVKHLREITLAGTTGEFTCIIWLSVDSFVHQ